MKDKPPIKDTSVVVTTKVKLTIQGQSFDLTTEELRALRDKINGAIGPENPTVIYAPERRERPFYPPPHYLTAPAPYLNPSARPMCHTGDPLPPQWVSTCSVGL